jgi:energy-coupling factor transporter ATP-binding protein EcfA2
VVTAGIRPVAIELTTPGYHYPDGISALAPIRLSVGAGERVALLGENGAGKTTLLLHLAALLPERQRYLHRHLHDDRPHRHEAAPSVTIDGIVVSKATVGSVRERVGVVFQDPDDQLIGLTVGEDVAYGPRARKWPEPDIAAAVSEALAAVGLAGFESRLPHHLSAGEKRRVCIAGVLACRPGLLLLDEPSSGLDPRGRRELTALLAGLAATQVIASHDLGFVASLCSRAVILERGAIVTEGAVAEILADRALLRCHGLE